MSFANAVLKSGVCDSGSWIGLVPCAVGGKAIREWARGERLYENKIRRTKEAVKDGSGEIKAMLWYQGESDTDHEHEVDEYRTKMEKLVCNVRADLGLPSLPIIQVAKVSGGKFVEKIREIQLGMEMENLRCVDADGLGLKEDNLHLTTAAQVKLGGMLAECNVSHFAQLELGEGQVLHCALMHANMQPSVKPEIIESLKRVAKPAHFTFKIKNFSLLSEALGETSNVESYEPPTFKACGHKWKVSFYPNGNKKFGGDEDHISMYLVAADDDIDVAGAEINAIFKFFVMDQLRDEYLTVQDGVVRRFHGLKKDWGFTKLIPMDTFKDETNGYLVDDCCVFGVEILVVAPSKMKSACLSLIKAPVNGTFTWKVDKFSAVTDSCTKSTPFKVEGYEWTLSISRHAGDGAEAESLSLYLWSQSFPSGSKIFVDFDLIVKDQLGGVHQQRNGKRWVDYARGYGYPSFMKLAEVKDKSKGFLVKDKIVVEVKINVISKIA